MNSGLWCGSSWYLMCLSLLCCIWCVSLCSLMMASIPMCWDSQWRVVARSSDPRRLLSVLPRAPCYGVVVSAFFLYQYSRYFTFFSFSFIVSSFLSLAVFSPSFLNFCCCCISLTGSLLACFFVLTFTYYDMLFEKRLTAMGWSSEAWQSLVFDKFEPHSFHWIWVNISIL